MNHVSLRVAAEATPTLAPHGSSLLLAGLVALLFGSGAYLVMQRAMTRVLVGFGLMTHAANVLLLMSGGYGAAPPFIPHPGDPNPVISDPLPQAFILTAIVISMAVTALLLALSYRSFALTHDDSVMDDVEDRRLSALTSPEGADVEESDR